MKSHVQEEASPYRKILGLRSVREAILARTATLYHVWIEARSHEAKQHEALARFASEQGIKVEFVERAFLDRIAQGELHQGVIAEASPLRVLTFNELMAQNHSDTPLFLALDEITDPQNFGAIVRSAVAFGVTGVLWPEDKSAPLSSAMNRASAGAVEHATLCRVTSLPRALREFNDRSIATIALDVSAKSWLHESTLNVPLCLVVGAEGKGLRHATKQACVSMARLPISTRIDSLNASVAAGIGLYEVARQRLL